ncbi:MAG: YggS family pyridoxal phosphate-dependent enzyme [Desulfobacterales bacterium]|nr:YggS family pyridoxal phosphate-dependent enzyme [Desulfobacterales bacterium]
MNDIKQNLQEIKERIRKAAKKSNRDPESIRLVAVSKTVPVETIQKAIEAGVTILGESYIQEARSKISAVSLPPASASWHFIGHLQTNKAGYAVRLFSLIHSVDSLKLAHALNREAGKINKIQAILIQVNIAKETTKSGIAAQEARKLMAEIGSLPNLKVKGLMTMPPCFNNPEKARPYFDDLRSLSEALQKNINADLAPNISMDELSMGMSGDFEVAIAAGATMVRIGTAIFGERD